MSEISPTGQRLGNNSKGPKGELPFYGRRKGRPLRPQMRALFDNALPEIAVPQGLKSLDGLFAHAPKDIYLESVLAAESIYHKLPLKHLIVVLLAQSPS